MMTAHSVTSLNK